MEVWHFCSLPVFVCRRLQSPRCSTQIWGLCVLLFLSSLAEASVDVEEIRFVCVMIHSISLDPPNFVLTDITLLSQTSVKLCIRKHLSYLCAKWKWAWKQVDVNALHVSTTKLQCQLTATLHSKARKHRSHQEWYLQVSEICSWQNHLAADSSVQNKASGMNCLDTADQMHVSPCVFLERGHCERRCHPWAQKLSSAALISCVSKAENKQNTLYTRISPWISFLQLLWKEQGLFNRESCEWLNKNPPGKKKEEEEKKWTLCFYSEISLTMSMFLLEFPMNNIIRTNLQDLYFCSSKSRQMVLLNKLLSIDSEP